MANVATQSPEKSPELEKIQKDFSTRSKDIQQISQQIKDLEKQLVKTNDRLIETTNAKKKLEVELAQLEGQINEGDENIINYKNEIAKRLRLALVNSIAGGENASELFAQKVLIKSLKRELDELNKVHQSNQNQFAMLKEQKNRLDEFMMLEKELSDVLTNLEVQKNELAQNYVAGKSQLERMQNELSAKSARAKLAAVKSKNVTGLESQFVPPIDEFLAYEHRKKGVTFSYSGRKPVLATQKGRVIFTGSLSTYGNVVMIDHGNETRSVILGQFTPKIEKGMIVNTFDVLGYTSDDTSGKGKIYFEVRQQNKVQDTLPLLDASRVAVKTNDIKKL